MTQELQSIIEESIDDIKGQDVTVLDVTELSDVMDTLIIVTGTSNRHVKSIANNVLEDAKKQGHRPIGVEGMDGGEWVLVDYGDIVLHVMQQATRDFYALEKLWSMEPSSRQQQSED